MKLLYKVVDIFSFYDFEITFYLRNGLKILEDIQNDDRSFFKKIENESIEKIIKFLEKRLIESKLYIETPEEICKLRVSYIFSSFL